MSDTILTGDFVVEEMASVSGITTGRVYNNSGEMFETGTNTVVFLWDPVLKTQLQSNALSLKKVYSFAEGDKVRIRNDKLASQIGRDGVIVPTYSKSSWRAKTEEHVPPGMHHVQVVTDVGSYDLLEWELEPADGTNTKEEDSKVSEENSTMEVFYEGELTHSLDYVISSLIDEDGDLVIKTGEDDGTAIHIVHGAWDTYVVKGTDFDA